MLVPLELEQPATVNGVTSLRAAADGLVLLRFIVASRDVGLMGH
jgi:hypothetical protein